MACHGTMSCLVLVLAIGRNQYGSHHSQRTESCAEHIAHHVAIIVLTSPDKASLTADNTSHSIVNQSIEILYAQLGKLLFIVTLVHLLENLAELCVIGLGDGVLGGKPKILLGVDSKLETAMCEAADTLVRVVHALNNTSTIKVVDFHLLLLSTLALEHEFSHSWLIGTNLHTLVYITISMTGNGDRLLPVLHTWVNAWNGDRCTKYSSVHDASDGSVRTFPHFVQLVFIHTLGIRSNRGTLYCHTIFLGSLSRVDGHLIVGLITIGQAQVIILSLEVDERQYQFILNHLPQDASHLVTVHLHQGSCHLNLFHKLSLVFDNLLAKLRIIF